MARRRRLVGAALTVSALACAAQGAEAACRLALALGLDVSGSVDPREYRLQLDGVAAALTDPAVRRAILDMPGAHVAIAVYQWAAPGQQQVIVSWTDLKGPDDLAGVAAQLQGTVARFSDPMTGIGAAMRYGAMLLDQRPECWRHTLDISGDGPSNAGPHPRDALPRGRAGARDPIVNALVINPGGRDNVTKDLTYTRTLLDHYRAEVLRGPGAFVETAATFDDFAAAMTRKLLREVQPAALSQRGQSGPATARRARQ